MGSVGTMRLFGFMALAFVFISAYSGEPKLVAATYLIVSSMWLIGAHVVEAIKATQ